jgi:hypothetical protein
LLTESSEALVEPTGRRIPSVSRLRPTSAAAASFFAALGVSLAFLAVQARHLWFFGDDWDFLLRRGVTGSPRQTLWEPHNEHWSTLPILAYRALYSVFGVRHYLPFAMLVILLHGAITVLLWSLLRRSGVRPWVAAGFGGVIALMAAGAENTLWDFQVGFVGSVFFGLLAIRLQPQGPRLGGRDVAACAAVIAGLMCSGQGLTMLVVVSLYAYLARGLPAAVAPAVSGLSAYGLWYLAVGHEGMGAPLDSVRGVPTYVFTGLGHVWEGMTGLPAIGLLVVLLAAVSAVRSESRMPREASALAIAGLLGALGLYTLVALTRAHFGLGMATTGRYAYIAAVLTAPALALGLQSLIADRPLGRGGRLLTTALLVLVGLSGVNTLIQWREWRVGLVGDDPQRVVGAWQLVRGDSPARVLRELPGSHYDTQLDIEGVRQAGREGKLPDLGANRPGMLAAASALFVNLSPNGLGLPPPATVVGGPGVSLSGQSLADGCIRGTTTAANGVVRFTVGGLGSAVVVSSRGKKLGTQLEHWGLASAVESWQVTPGTPYSVGSTATGMTLRLVFPAPVRFTLCA